MNEQKIEDQKKAVAQQGSRYVDAISNAIVDCSKDLGDPEAAKGDLN